MGTPTDTIINQGAIASASGRRIEYIDLAKGVCIVLVVFHHCGLEFTDRFYLLQHLRMPLYFFISGLFFRDYGGFFRTMLRKADRLILPLLFFSLIAMMVGAIFRIATGGTFRLSDYFSGGSIHVIGVWFLICLFWQAAICHIVLSLAQRTWVRITATVLIGFCGMALARTNLNLPLYIETAMTAFPFYFFGYTMKGSRLLSGNRNPARELPLAALLVLIACLTALINGSGIIVFYINEYSGSATLSIIQSAAIVIAALLLMKQVGRLPLLSYIGRYSLIILGIHGIVSSILITVSDMAGITRTTVGLSLAVLALSILTIEPLRRLFPHFTGRSNLLSRHI